MPITQVVVPHGDEAELYLRHHRALVCSVARSVNASRELIEDACQTAWLILLRRQPERTSTFAWLRVIAIREAYRLSGVERRDARLDAPTSPNGSTFAEERFEDPRAAPDPWVEARLALARVAQLPPRQRRLFALQIAGLSYEETSAVTGDSVRTVERQLRRAHARVRRQPA
ncbi:MAG: RNA polymerase sigma factor [Thermoleophilaceae bacterium]